MINSTVVVRSEVNGYTQVINDTTDHALDDFGCYTVTDASPNAVHGMATLTLGINYEQAVTVMLRSVTVTWTRTV